MEFLDDLGIWIYVIIFFGKILEVTVSTIRMVLINRGERVKGTIVAFFDSGLWLLITGTVLDGFQEDPMRMIVFALAFAVGNYMGSWFEDKLAFGLSSIQVIVPEGPSSVELADTLRKDNFAVTVVKGTGRNGNRDILMLHLKRKRIAEAVNLVNTMLPGAVVVVNDSKIISGGYISRKSERLRQSRGLEPLLGVSWLPG
jgi:uncharacterized protein YebE (UPF0316 family)